MRREGREGGQGREVGRGREGKGEREGMRSRFFFFWSEKRLFDYFRVMNKCLNYENKNIKLNIKTV